MILNSLTIAGVDRKALLVPGSLSIEDQLNARDTCRLRLRDTGAARPHVGQVVQITMDSVLIFAGTINAFEERNLTNKGTGATVEYDIDVVDYNQLADRRLHAEIYDDFTMKAIVEDIVADQLAGDGVTVDAGFPTGPTIDYFVANYDTCAELFDKLSEMTGYMWNIGPAKVLQFTDRSSLVAPVSLTQGSSTDVAYSLSITRSRDRYRNVQHLRGGLTETETIQTENFKGDGAQRTFVVSLPVSRVPIVKVNTVAQTVGIRQVDTGKDWYWQENSNEISQDFGGTLLTSSDTVTVEYRGYFPLLTIHLEDAAVAERVLVEGGTGLYHHMESDEDITNAQLARDRTTGLLRRFGAIHTELEFTTRVLGWAPGQLLPVDRAEHGVNADFLIASVQLQHQSLNDYVYNIRCVSGEAVESWVAFFARLAEARLISRRSQNESKSQILSLIRTASETVTVTEAAPSVVQPSESVWEVGDEVGVSEVAA